MKETLTSLDVELCHAIENQETVSYNAFVQEITFGSFVDYGLSLAIPIVWIVTIQLCE